MILFSQGKAAGQECGESQCEEGSGGTDGTGRARCTAVHYCTLLTITENLKFLFS
jgi:hypothetical protein